MLLDQILINQKLLLEIAVAEVITEEHRMLKSDFFDLFDVKPGDSFTAAISRLAVDPTSHTKVVEYFKRVRDEKVRDETIFAITTKSLELKTIGKMRWNLNLAFRHLELTQVERNWTYSLLDRIAALNPEMLTHFTPPATEMNMSIAVILAMDPLGAIGLNGTLPWGKGVLPGELAEFRKITGNNVLIMGKNTFNTSPNFPNGFTDRVNIVMSKSLHTSTSWLKDFPKVNSPFVTEFTAENIADSPVKVERSFHEAMETLAKLTKFYQRDISVFIIGGASLVVGALLNDPFSRYLDKMFITITHDFYRSDVELSMVAQNVAFATRGADYHWELDPTNPIKEASNYTMYTLRKKRPEPKNLHWFV